MLGETAALLIGSFVGDFDSGADDLESGVTVVDSVLCSAEGLRKTIEPVSKPSPKQTNAPTTGTVVAFQFMLTCCV